MSQIYYSRHLELRLKLRKFLHDLPRKIYRTSQERYFDTMTERFIAVKRARYGGKLRELAVAYEETSTGAVLITIHPLKPLQKEGRIKSGRWRRV